MVLLCSSASLFACLSLHVVFCLCGE